MSNTYSPVLWNRQKKIYDRVMLGVMLLYLALFGGFNLVLHPAITIETLIIRASGTLAILMLHLILMIGPLARLDKRFLALLYNRRHLGVSMFMVALIHGVFSLIQFHLLGDEQPLLSLFLANTHYNTVAGFPFQTLGFMALLILFVMAATSHDFWLHNLSPRLWKNLHMAVYLAYVLIVMHVMLGVVQMESSPIIVGLIALGVMVLIGLHLTAALVERRRLVVLAAPREGYVEVCAIGEIAEDRAKVVLIEGENIAIFKYDNQLSAVHNVCKHQQGPLGEGKIVDGCITCPWHGYQYHPADGQSPPPFTEKLSTYDLKVVGGKVYVNPNAYPEGTYCEPTSCNTSSK